MYLLSSIPLLGIKFFLNLPRQNIIEWVVQHQCVSHSFEGWQVHDQGSGQSIFG
jgi:hypothetical protein